MEAPKIPTAQTENEARVERLDKAAEEAAEHEREGLVLDFDEALTEFRKQTKRIEIRLLGKTFFLPPSTPANFAVFYLRHCLTKVEGGWTFAVPEDKFLEFVELMFGTEVAKEIGESDMEIAFVIRHIVPRVLVSWGLQFLQAEEDDTGKVTAVEAIPES